MNYFQGCSTDAERKARFRALAKIHHPDKGGDENVMKEINEQYSAKPGPFDRANAEFKDFFSTYFCQKEKPSGATAASRRANSFTSTGAEDRFADTAGYRSGIDEEIQKIIIDGINKDYQKAVEARKRREAERMARAEADKARRAKEEKERAEDFLKYTESAGPRRVQANKNTILEVVIGVDGSAVTMREYRYDEKSDSWK